MITTRMADILFTSEIAPGQANYWSYGKLTPTEIAHTARKWCALSGAAVEEIQVLATGWTVTPKTDENGTTLFIASGRDDDGPRSRSFTNLVEAIRYCF